MHPVHYLFEEINRHYWGIPTKPERPARKDRERSGVAFAAFQARERASLRGRSVAGSSMILDAALRRSIWQTELGRIHLARRSQPWKTNFQAR